MKDFSKVAIALRPMALLLLFGCFAILLSRETLAQQVVYVKANATGLNDGTSWIDAFTSLQDALNVATDNSEIWVASGTYNPDQGSSQTVGDRTASFHLKQGVQVYGGFSGIELNRNERDWQANETILSGDLAGNDNDNVNLDEPTRGENSIHVVIAGNTVDSTAVLDGFIITGGQADGTPPLTHMGGGMSNTGSPLLRYIVFTKNAAGLGGGMSNSGNLTLTHITFSENVSSTSGGGMYNSHDKAVLQHVTFQANRSGTFGGGMYNNRSEVVILDARFIGNVGDLGGGMYNREGSQTITNTIFLGNEALYDGGGIANDENTLILANAVFSGNTAQDNGGGMFNFGSTLTASNVTLSHNHTQQAGGGVFNEQGNPDPPLIAGKQSYTNSIFVDNTAADSASQVFRTGHKSLTISYSLIEGGLPDDIIDGGGNLNADPFFVDAVGADGIPGTEDDDLHLRSTSPAIDAGNNSSLPVDSLDLDQDGDTTEGLPVDLENRARIYDGGSGQAVVDLGAYEFDAPLILQNADPEEHERPESENLALKIYPNPFHSQIVVRFTLSQSAFLRVDLYDVLGRRLDTLYEGILGADKEQEINVDGSRLPPGLYVVRFVGVGIEVARTIVLIR